MERSERDPVGRAIELIADRLVSSPVVRSGEVHFRLTGDGAGDYRLVCAPHAAQVVKAEGIAPDTTPLVEVMGDGETVRAILAGELDARDAFLRGGLRVRGDLRYLSNAALELGILTEPL
jgi:putative sterol carrier protein